jgi:hypothetical protein
MISTYELELFAKQAATGYLRDSKSLNESITKIASDNALNKEQIARVVEAANTEVYINLFNKNQDKYVQFDTANPSAIEATLTNVKVGSVTTTDSTDYYEAPAYEAPEFTPIFEKVAEEAPVKSEDQVLKDYWQFKAAEANLTGLLLEGQMVFQKEADTLREMIKQTVLGGTKYADVHLALTAANADPIFVETLKAIETELTPNMPLGSLTKTGSALPGTVNAKHPLIQQSLTLVKVANEFQTIQTKLTDLYSEWELYKEGGKLKNTVELVTKNPKPFGLGLVVGVGGTALALPAIAKERAAQEANPINEIPVRYRG